MISADADVWDFTVCSRNNNHINDVKMEYFGRRNGGCCLTVAYNVVSLDKACNRTETLNGCKSKRPLVKTPPSQNVPELVKTSPNTKKRLVKTSP